MAQTTSIATSTTYGAYSTTNFPTGAFSWQMRVKWTDFASANSYQNVFTIHINSSNATIQLYLDTSAEQLRVYRDSNGFDSALATITSSENEWATVGVRWDGNAANPVSVWFLDDDTDTWTSLNVTGTAAAITQLEVAKYTVSGEEPTNLRICTGILRSGYMTQAECTAQALSDTPTDLSSGSGATVNRWWKLDDNANANDSSGNGYNGSIHSGGSTVSDVPYNSGVSGSSTHTQAGDTLVSAGTVRVSGASAKTQADDSLAAAGAVRVSGSSSHTQAGDTLVAAGSVRVLGASAHTQAGDTQSASGAVRVTGALSKTQASDTLSATGTTGSTAINGASAHTQAGDSLASSGAVRVSGASAKTQAGDSVSATGTVFTIGTQATSVNANGQFGLQVPLAVTNLPPDEFTLMVRARVNDWNVGDPLGNILAANCLNGYVQIFADIDDPAGNGDRFIRVYQGEEATPVYYDLNDVQEFTGWALFAIRNDGLGGDTEVVMIPDGGSPIVLPMTGDFGRLRQFYVLGLVTVPEQAEDVDACTVICFADYKDNAFLLAQADSSTPLAAANRFYPMDAAATAHIDASGNGYDANHSGTATTTNDSPYVGTLGSSSHTQAGDTLSAAGKVATHGASAHTQASDTLAATGVVRVVGSSAVTQASDTLVSAATVRVSGSSSKTQAGDSLSSAGVVVTHGASNHTQAGDTLAADGLLDFDGVAGTSAHTQGGDTLSAAATVRVAGSSSNAQVGDTLNAAGVVLLFGSSNHTQAGDSASAAARVVVSGSLSVTQADDVASAVAEAGARVGAANITQAGDVLAAIGRVLVSGFADITQAGDTATGLAPEPPALSSARIDGTVTLRSQLPEYRITVGRGFLGSTS